MDLYLPSFDHKLRKVDGKLQIWDIVRKKFIILTPEEWVRQHYLHYLTQILKYPATLITVEGGLHYNSSRKRTDIVVYQNDGIPYIVIECKASYLNLNQSTVRQASIYYNKLNPYYLVLTNGISEKIICLKEQETQLLSIPPYVTEQ